MQGFNGFPPGKTALIAVPSQFFSELLPLIDHLGELKVTLYCFWALQQQEGDYRYVRLHEMVNDQVLLASFNVPEIQQKQALQDGLERAVTRGTLLHVTVQLQNETQNIYFMNTVNGRNAIRAIEKGDWLPGGNKRPIELIIERPNIFVLYEQNIGSITPYIADQLRSAETDYPQVWLIEALYIAVERNIRNWRYINGILERWHREGKENDGFTGEYTQRHASSTEEDYSDIIGT